ncbi:MAG TPA: DUF4097 family beta strand repeat-containing protein [Terriglobia bacterium]|nr:DUF4097 family beta strand repeat-containing protein [Terriglobia bacterium]
METRGRRSESKYLMALAATYLAFSTSAFATEGHFDRTLPVTGPVEVNVRTGAGSLTVSAGGNSSVQVHATIRAWRGLFSGEEAEKRVRYLEAHPPIEQHGNTITLGATTDPGLQHNISISYKLVVPAATRLKSRTGSGDQTIEGIDGPLDLSTGSGRLKASNIGNSVQASTGSGDIELESVKGNIRASSGSGGIRAWGIAGSFRASTGSGDVTLAQTSVADARVSSASGHVSLKNVHGLVHAKTASGSISAEGGGQEPWHLETVSGSVTVRVPPGLGFDLQAHTVSGSVSATQPLTLQGTANHREITGKAGNGGFLLDVSTVSGNVHIDWVAPPQPPSAH